MVIVAGYLFLPRTLNHPHNMFFIWFFYIVSLFINWYRLRIHFLIRLFFIANVGHLELNFFQILQSNGLFVSSGINYRVFVRRGIICKLPVRTNSQLAGNLHLGDYLKRLFCTNMFSHAIGWNKWTRNCNVTKLLRISLQ